MSCGDHLHARYGQAGVPLATRSHVCEKITIFTVLKCRLARTP